MKISLYTPELTCDEAERFWMTPKQVCQLAAIGEASDPKVKKLLNTLSDRGHVPFVKSGEAKTAPRLYSLVSAAMLRVIFDITRDGRTYKYAQPIADEVRKTLLGGIQEYSDLADFDLENSHKRLLFADIKDNGTPRIVSWRESSAEGEIFMANSLYNAGYLIFRILGVYADYWHDDLEARGEIARPEPVQIGEDGWPIEGGENG